MRFACLLANAITGQSQAGTVAKWLCNVNLVGPGMFLRYMSKFGKSLTILVLPMRWTAWSFWQNRWDESRMWALERNGWFPKLFHHTLYVIWNLTAYCHFVHFPSMSYNNDWCAATTCTFVIAAAAQASSGRHKAYGTFTMKSPYYKGLYSLTRIPL